MAPQVLVWQFRLDRITRANVTKAYDLVNALELALGVSGVRIGRGNGVLTIEIPSPCRFYVPAGSLPRGDGLVIPFGFDMYLEPVFIDFGEHPHLLILGSSGLAGKSETMRTLLWSLLRQTSLSRVACALVDLKGGQALQDFQGDPHVVFPVATHPEEAMGVLQWMREQVRERFEERDPQPHIFLFVDEIFVLVREIPESRELLGELTATARSANVHVVLASQEAKKETLGHTLVSRNITARIIGRTDNPQSSFLGLGARQAGANCLLGNGDVVVRLGGDLRRVQVALVTEEDLAGLPRGGTLRNLPPYLKVERRGGHNKARLQDEWIEWFREGGSVRGAMREFGLSSHVAMRARDAANGKGLEGGLG